MPVAVVTGANSGIGYAWTQLLIQQGWKVFAIDIRNDQMQKLDCTCLELNLATSHRFDQVVDVLNDSPLDLLLNVAGVMSHPEEDALATCSLEVLQSTFAVNTFAPFLLTQALLPSLQKSKNARIGIVSSRVGSIADNSSSGSYAYRSSKSAVNQIGKCLAIDLKDKNIPVILLHPGFTATNLMAKDLHHPESVSATEAAEKLHAVLMAKGVSDSGKFYHREGTELPW